MVDWKEIEQLQAELHKAQQSETMQRLSERNCIEILMKLESMKLINVLHSCDGKEYLTPGQLSVEIHEEIEAHGGRINVVDLQSLLNVDFSEVERKCQEIANKEKHTHLVFGQLVNSAYFDRLAEEINEALQASGHVTIGHLSKSYDLPGDFLSKEISSRFGRIIQGKLDSQRKDTIYTDAFIARHKHRIRGILSAVTRPVAVSLLCHNEDLSPNLASMIIAELIREGRISGHLTGSEGSSFIPAIYSQSQNNWVDSFFKQNDYIEYDAISRLGVNDPRSYLKIRLDQPILLPTVCVGRGIVEQMLGHVEETLDNNEWSDVTLLLPSSFSADDIRQLLEHVIKELKRDAVILCDVIVTGRRFVESCLDCFKELIKEKSDKEVTKAKALSVSEEQRKEVVAQAESHKKADKKEERRRRAMEGSSKRSSEHGGGSGQGAREVRSRGIDKKKLRKQREQEESKRKSHRISETDDDVISTNEVEAVLRVRFPGWPEQMREEIAGKLIEPLSAKVESSVKSVFLQQREEGGTEERGKKRRSRKQLAEDVNHAWTMWQLCAESFKFFTEGALTSLQKYLLQTTGTRIADTLFLILAGEFLPEVHVEEPLTEEGRLSLVPRLPAEMRTPMTKLHQSLTKKTCNAFQQAFNDAVDPSVCDVRIKGLDKQKTRQLMHGHKMSLIAKMESETNPSQCFHLCVAVVFQSMMGTMLDIPGKLIPSALQELESHLEQDVYAELHSYEQLVMKVSAADAQKRGIMEVQLEEGLPRIRQLASSVKKQAA